MKSEETFRSYVAGFFDGEGNINIDRKWCNVRLTLGNANRDVLAYVLEGCGYGTVTQRKAQKSGWVALWVWRTGRAHDVRDFLTATRPYLIVKAAEADRALAIIAKMQERECALLARNDRILADLATKRLTQRDIAIREGVSQQLISRLKSGASWPSEVRRLNARRSIKKSLAPRKALFGESP